MSTQLQRIRWPLVMLLVLVLQWVSATAADVSSSIGNAARPSASGFNESLLLRPLHNGKIMMHWQFEVRTEGNEGKERRVALSCTLLGDREGDRLT